MRFLSKANLKRRQVEVEAMVLAMLVRFIVMFICLVCWRVSAVARVSSLSFAKASLCLPVVIVCTLKVFVIVWRIFVVH